LHLQFELSPVRFHSLRDLLDCQVVEGVVNLNFVQDALLPWNSELIDVTVLIHHFVLLSIGNNDYLFDFETFNKILSDDKWCTNYYIIDMLAC